MKKTLEEVRDKLNTMVVSDEFTSEEILSVSQELDKLIIYYYETQDKITSRNLDK